METFLFLEAGPSIVVHTSVPFSLQHLETDKEEMKHVIMSHLAQVLPDLPQPTEIKSHKWRYSQVNAYRSYLTNYFPKNKGNEWRYYLVYVYIHVLLIRFCLTCLNLQKGQSRDILRLVHS